MDAPRRRHLALLLAAGLAASLMSEAAGAAAGETQDFLKAGPDDLAWWREARFGLFIHWGPVSLKGTEIGWSRGGERRGRSGRGPIPAEEYDTLYKAFNPTKFNAEEWVAIAKAAGMKYLVFTTKHHDGFSMFDSRLTDYTIAHSPFKRDVVAELAKACHEGGLRLGFYYSPPDWYHPDYRTANHARYIEFLHGQLRELCTNYGKVDIIWFDGLGGKAADWDSPNLVKMIRGLQPRVLINNRAGLPGDFDTPEQRVGTFQIDRPWETCMTICRQWAWKPGDTMKSLKQCLDTLIRCAGGDGNLLFNVGPMPTGEIEPRQVARLKEMGAWLREYGESIYATRGGPFRPGPWGASTHRGDTIYLHILQWTGDSVRLPPIEKKIIGHRVLTGGTAEVRQTAEAIEVSVPPLRRQELDTLVALRLDGPAADIQVGALRSGSVAMGKKAAASNVYRNMKQHGPEKALDDDPGTRWATDAGTREAWIEVDLSDTVTIGRTMIDECVEWGQRVRRFELQYKDGDAWKTFLEGPRIGRHYTKQFPPVRARHVRLNILEATDGPTLWEFQLFEPRQGGG